MKAGAAAKVALFFGVATLAVLGTVAGANAAVAEFRSWRGSRTSGGAQGTGSGGTTGTVAAAVSRVLPGGLTMAVFVLGALLLCAGGAAAAAGDLAAPSFDFFGDLSWLGLVPLLGASGQVGGQYFLARGNPQRWDELCRGRVDVWDNAAGSNPFYLAPGGLVALSGKPFDDGVPLALPFGPHVGPNQGLYSGCIATTSDGSDSDDGLMVVNLEGTIYQCTPDAEFDAMGKLVKGRVISSRPFLASAEGDRITNSEDINLGLAADTTFMAGRPALLECWAVMGPGEFLFLHGRGQLDHRDDTA